MDTNSPKHCYFPTDERKREIAAAARAIIVEKGFEGLRTREVAARVGINIATLHYHVSSKQALIELVIQSMRAQFAEQSVRNSRDNLGPEEKLRLEMQEYKEILLHHPDLLQLMEEMTTRARVDPHIEAQLREMRKRWHRDIVDVLTEGRDKGVFRSDLDPLASAHIVQGALVSFQYKPKHMLPLFDSVADEIIRSIIVS
jgi:AcrR family transcriptional regulator